MPFFVGLETGPLGLDSRFINKDPYLFLKILIKIHVNKIILLITIQFWIYLKKILWHFFFIILTILFFYIFWTIVLGYLEGL